MAITGSQYLNFGKTRIDNFFSLQTKSLEDSARFLAQLKTTLPDEIKKFGDESIADTAFIEEFLEDVRVQGEQLGQQGQNPFLQLLKSFGISPADIPARFRLSKIGDLAAFFRQLEIATKKVSIELDALKRNVRMENIPSWIIQHTLRSYRDPSLRRSGSELVDRHLICLAPYADVTFVDKRIKENVQRAGNRSEKFLKLVHRIEKVAHYSKIPQYLD